MTTKVCAVVVAFHPDDEFESRLIDVLPQISALVVVDNTPAEVRRHAIVMPVEGDKPVCLIENTDNLGVAAALNQGLKQALEWNCGWLLTLDQDTQCDPEMVSVLRKISASCGEEYAVIGSNYFDPRSNRTKVAKSNCQEWKEQKTVITSGSLVNVTKAHSVGGVRDDFIDQVDHEFCLRLRAHGYKVAISYKPLMTHSVDNSGGERYPLLGVFAKSSTLGQVLHSLETPMVMVANYYIVSQSCLRRCIGFLLGLAGWRFWRSGVLARFVHFYMEYWTDFQGAWGFAREMTLYEPRVFKPNFSFWISRKRISVCLKFME